MIHLTDTLLTVPKFGPPAEINFDNFPFTPYSPKNKKTVIGDPYILLHTDRHMDADVHTLLSPSVSGTNLL